MKRDEEKMKSLLDRYLRRYVDPEARHRETAVDRVWQRLKSESVSAPIRVASDRHRRDFWSFGIAAVAVALFMASSTFLVRNTLRTEAPSGIAKAAYGELTRLSDGAAKPLAVGDQIQAGEMVHSLASGGALELTDGSRVEIRAESELAVERAEDGVRIRLDKGSVIVNAAKRRAGHLYVKTKDMTASVVGTVFLVNAELRGSRVAVIQGVVRVERGGSAESLHPGEQVASSARMEARPVSEEIAWSRQAEEHLALLQQSAAPPLATTQDAKDAFEVASIRPSGPVAAGGGRGGGEASDAGPCPGSSVGSVRLQFQLDPGRLAITRLTLYHLIALAYGNRCPAPGYLSGGPDWAKSERFNLEAKIPEGTTAYTKEQLLGGNAPRLQRMLQVLLADRFKLVLKREIRQMPAYNLIVAKPGKLRSSEDQTPDALPGPAARGLAGAGLVITLPSRSAPISRFANNLQEILKMPVIDKTDLTGLYDIVLTFPELGSLPPPSQNPDPGVFDKLNEEISERLPERLPAKLEQETGLKLERTTAPMEVFVIEHAEKPAEN